MENNKSSHHHTHEFDNTFSFEVAQTIIINPDLIPSVSSSFVSHHLDPSPEFNEMLHYLSDIFNPPDSNPHKSRERLQELRSYRIRESTKQERPKAANQKLSLALSTPNMTSKSAKSNLETKLKELGDSLFKEVQQKEKDVPVQSAKDWGGSVASYLGKVMPYQVKSGDANLESNGWGIRGENKRGFVEREGKDVLTKKIKIEGKKQKVLEVASKEEVSREMRLNREKQLIREEQEMKMESIENELKEFLNSRNQKNKKVEKKRVQPAILEKEKGNGTVKCEEMETEKVKVEGGIEQKSKKEVNVSVEKENNVLGVPSQLSGFMEIGKKLFGGNTVWQKHKKETDSEPLQVLESAKNRIPRNNSRSKNDIEVPMQDRCQDQGYNLKNKIKPRQVELEELEKFRYEVFKMTSVYLLDEEIMEIIQRHEYDFTSSLEFCNILNPKFQVYARNSLNRRQNSIKESLGAA